MARCIRCGGDADDRRVCHACSQKWRHRRRAAWKQAIEEIGPLTDETHKALVKRTKQLERAAEVAERGAVPGGHRRWTAPNSNH